MSTPVRYRLEVHEPARHRVRVRARFPPVPGGRYDLRIPAWSPGSYLIREYARNVLDPQTRDGRGRPLPASKRDKATWRVEGARDGLVVEWEVYGFERSVRTNHVTSDHAFLSGPATFLYTDELRSCPVELEVRAPRGWRVACGLDRRGKAFLASDYDELVDSPIECGHLRELRFEAGDTPFRLVICGRGNHDPARLRRDLARIAAAERDLFGWFPFPRYLAILNLTPASRGGLEHRASTALEWPRWRFRPEEKYEDFLALFAHELFHAWNVKAAAPRAFRPYDYRRETPTRLLWWFEGVTDYYDELLLARSGLLTPRRYLERLAERWEHLLETPGRHRMSVEAASFDAWIRFYRPDENSPNVSVSYYEKGHLVGLLLDLEIRRRTGGRRSLDDALRLVVARGGKGLPEDGVRRAVEDATGLELGRFFADHVAGTAELPLGRALTVVGLELAPPDPKARPGGWLGATLKTQAGRLSLHTVATGGPADRAGLSAGDELVALDGQRVDEAGLRDRLEERRPGQRVRLTLFRDEELREATVRLGPRPDRLKLVASKDATPEQRRAFESWLGQRWATIAG